MPIDKKERLLALLNALVCVPGGKDIYEKIGQRGILHLTKEQGDDLLAQYPELGLRTQDDHYIVTVAALLASITEVLCGERLAFVIEDNDDNEIITTGFRWWKNPDAPPEGTPLPAQAQQPLPPTVDQWALQACEKIARQLGWCEEINQPFWCYLQHIYESQIHLDFPFASLLLSPREGDHSAQSIRRILRKALHSYEQIVAEELSTCCLAPEILVSGSIAKGIDQIKCMHCGASIRGPKETLWREWKRKYFKPL